MMNFPWKIWLLSTSILIFLIFSIKLDIKGGVNMRSYFTFQISERAVAHPPQTHYHPDYEVYYLTEGQCRYFIGSKTYQLNQGDIVVIPPGIIHKVIYETPTHSRLLINCTEDYIPPSALERIDQFSYFSLQIMHLRFVNCITLLTIMHTIKIPWDY